MRTLTEYADFEVQMVGTENGDPNAADIWINYAGSTEWTGMLVPDVCFENFVDCLIIARKRFREITKQHQDP
jgi:hypothetical protein